MAFTIDPNLLGLEGAVAYVTGAAQGIGRGCALQLARAGCHVVVVDANREKAMAAVDAVEALGRRSLHVAADVRSAEGMQEVIERTRSVLGPVDVACHVVGNPAHAPKPLLDTTKLSSYMTGHAVFSDGGVVHTTARPPVGLDIVPAALAHLDWVRAAYATDASGS